MDLEKIEAGVKLIIEGIGEDCSREGLIETPERVARMYEEVFSGLTQNAKEHLLKTFIADGNEMVIEKDIILYSMCEHHLMPFYGRAHIAYIPDGKVVGISKLARTVDVFAKRPQIQEKLTYEIADEIMKDLKPLGVIVAIEAEHTCMTMRGVKKPGTKTFTFACRGEFEKNQDLKNTFFNLIKI